MQNKIHQSKKKFFISFFLFALTLGYELPAKAIEFTAHGYYRARFEFTHDLDLQRPNEGIVPGDPANNSNDRFGTVAFAQQRFRLQPSLKFNDHISIHGEIDFLDNLLFGQSDVETLQFANPIVGSLILPEAQAPYGVVGSSGGATVGSGGGNFNVRQVYVDVMTSGGKFRIGRQSFKWGLGILSNDGGGMEGDYGDIFDRIFYAAGFNFNNGGQLLLSVVYDFAFEAQADPSIAGLDGGLASNWSDVMQGGLVLMYQTENFQIGTLGMVRYRNGEDGEPATTATYIYDKATDGFCPDSATPSVTCDDDVKVRNDPNTGQPLIDGISGIEKPAGIDGDTLLYIIDLYTSFTIAKNYKFSFEGAYIGGKIAPGVAIDAIVLDDAAQAGITNPLAEPITLPLNGTQNDVQIFMAAFEGQAKWNFGGEVNIQAGYASGDEAPLSSKITQLGFRPDYDIALMMFDVPLGTSPAFRIGGITELGRKPMTPNYVNNAIYFTFEYKQEFDITSGVPWASDFKVGAKFITAWAPSNNLDMDFSEITGVENLPYVVNQSKWYGFEVDIAAEATFFEFMKWKTTLGLLLPGGVFDIKNDAATRATAGIIDPIAFDNAEAAFAAKTTLFFEF